MKEQRVNNDYVSLTAENRYKVRYFIHLAYDGTNYHGWQRQPNGRSVQQVLEEALSMLLHHQISLTGAGRTDTGVHASSYFAHFDLQTELPADAIQKLIFKLNSFLNKDIAVYEIFPVNHMAHARFSAISRTYQYHVLRRKDPFRITYAYFLYGTIDLDIMNEGANHLTKFQDFTSFSKVDTDSRTNICSLSQCQWKEVNDALVFTITSNRFLRNMVRAITGTLLDLGRGRVTPEQFNEIIIGKNRSLAGESVPARGLFLTDIAYPESIQII
jgi:tRNA pseudouridine38-40 synthase